MTETMIHRLAKVIGEIYDGWVDPEGTPNRWPLALGSAVDALQTIREPTDAMVNAANAELDKGYRDAGTIWRAMIDAALRERCKPERSAT